jgi:hypothetical protein
MGSVKKINSRRKGQTAERKLVKLFEKWWGSKFFRTPGSGAFATRGFAGMNTASMAGDIITDGRIKYQGFPAQRAGNKFAVSRNGEMRRESTGQDSRCALYRK